IAARKKAIGAMRRKERKAYSAPAPRYPAMANCILDFSVLSQLDRLSVSTNCLTRPLGFTLNVPLFWDAINRSRSRARIRSRSVLTAANSIARKWASENLATIWSSMGGLDLEVE